MTVVLLVQIRREMAFLSAVSILPEDDLLHSYNRLVYFKFLLE